MSIDHLVPFDSRIYGNVQVPSCAGRLVSAWDDPRFANAQKAEHMRDDDYVIGAIHKGMARAYPLWIVDHYHIINDVFVGDPVVFTSCERCQSGSMHLARLPDRSRIKFSAVGVYNASLIMADRVPPIRGKASLWIHFNGTAIAGPCEGKSLPRVPVYHHIWKDWKDLHPDTEVMIEPGNSVNPDERQGHGRDEYFSRPGMELAALQSINGELDVQYPESELILGVHVDRSVRAYPLREVKNAGGVLHDRLGGRDLVIFCGPASASFTMSAFERRLDDGLLEFVVKDECFVDQVSGSRWNVEGKAVAGPWVGRSLQAVRWSQLRWHSWVYAHKDRSIYIHTKRTSQYPGIADPKAEIVRFKPVLGALRSMHPSVRVEHPVVALQLPHEAEAGLCLRVAQDRLRLYVFKTVTAARDYVFLQGAYQTPLVPRLARKESCCHGRFVLESDPERQYADPAQVVRLPDPEICWSKVVTDPVEVAGWTEKVGGQEQPATGGFSGLIANLRKYRYDVVDVAFLPHCQLYPNVESGFSATIEGDRFSVFRCSDANTAELLAASLGHAIAIQRWVLLSNPEKRFKYPRWEIGREEDTRVPWSRLLSDQRFTEVVAAAVD